MKVIAMIPARLGSKRIKKKNLRLIDGKPLISYVLDSVAKCECFDEVYVNSEAPIFDEIAKAHGCNFYQRLESLSSDQATNDEFCYDFMQNVNGDIIIQILPTSPFITTGEIEDFTNSMLKDKCDTLISVEDKQIACIYRGHPINFDKQKINPPSQSMIPVQAYATVLMGWTYENYDKNMQKFGSAYHGGDGKVSYFPLRGLSTIDIDREEDFLLAESIILSKKIEQNKSIDYYGEKSEACL